MIGRRVLAAALFLAGTLLPPAPAAAAAAPGPGAAPSEKSAAAIKRDIARRSRILKEHERDLDALKKERESYDRSIKRLDRRLSLTESQIRIVSGQIAGYRAQISDLENLEELSRKRLRAMVRNLYVAGNDSPLKILLGGAEPGRSDRYLTYCRVLARQRRGLIADMEKSEADLKRNQAKLEGKRREFSGLKREYDRSMAALSRERTASKSKEESLRSDIVAEKKQIEAQEKALREIERTIAARKAELARKRKEEERKALESARLKAEREGRNSEQAVREEKEKLARSGALHGLGKNLPRPAAGRIIRNFGDTRFTSTKWTGVVISGSPGGSVTAVAPGDVLYAGWLNGWGNIIIIDHGRDYLTIYANNGANLAASGARVRTGEVIARIGNSGGLPDHSLYFEIRKNGAPLDPRKFFR